MSACVCDGGDGDEEKQEGERTADWRERPWPPRAGLLDAHGQLLPLIFPPPKVNQTLVANPLQQATTKGQPLPRDAKMASPLYVTLKGQPLALNSTQARTRKQAHKHTPTQTNANCERVWVAPTVNPCR